VLLLLQLALIALALGAWLVAIPPAWIERTFSTDLYPSLQSALTSSSNTTRIAIFDVLVVLIAITAIVACGRAVRRAWRGRRIGPLVTGARIAVALVAFVYLWFLAAWGLNYRRVPAEQAPGFDGSRVTPAAVRALATRAVAEVNQRHDAAHRAGFPPVDSMPPDLVRALHDVERSLGRPRPTVPARPKRSLLSPFFRAAGVDGMLAPFMLETLINPDLTGPERPIVLAHEWAHLSGYAPEDEASFVGVLAALQADAPSQYSAWLSLVFDTTALLTTPERQKLLEALAEGPRRDQAAIVARLMRRVDVVQRASWVAYDGYLKSQGVDEGVLSYGGVVRLLIGSGRTP
jgi:hypothetical protein